MSRNFIVATAGHIDHGKSALVKALTGTDPDRLPEERARGITIDLGFASLQLAGTAGEQVFNLGVVDVPGHEDFVKNMVAGVGAIDLALLVVAADDGWMPQTEEHLQILVYLGVTRAVVALTKIDRTIDGQRSTTIQSIRERLVETPFAGAPIVGTSVVTGAGLDELQAAMRAALAGAPIRPETGKPRLWIDRVFSLRGVGTVVTGTLTGGVLRAGMSVHLAPDRTAHIRAIHHHGRACESALPASRTALNLVGDAAALARRGALVTTPELSAAHDTCDVWLERSTRQVGTSIAMRSVPHGAGGWLHVGTAAVACRIVLVDRTELRAGEAAPAQLRLADALSLMVGERFVIRDASERITLAGGVVLDPTARRMTFRREIQQAFLRAQRAALSHPARALLAQLARDGHAQRASLGARWMCAPAEVEAALAAHVAGGAVIDLGAWVAASGHWRKLEAEARRAIQAHHEAHPAQNGIPVAQWRLALRKFAHVPALLDAVLQQLLRDGFELCGASIRARTFQPRLPAGLATAASRLRDTLETSGLNPPCRSALAPDAARRQALDFLLKTQAAVALSAEVVLATTHFQAAAERIQQALVARGAATVSELRQALGTSRRVMVPLLEQLDRAGLTVRRGEQRLLARTADNADRAAQPPAKTCP